VLALAAWAAVLAHPSDSNQPAPTDREPASAIDDQLGRARQLRLDGKPDEALALFRSALDAAREAGLSRQEGYALCGLGLLADDRGQFGQARELAEQALSAFDQVRDDAGLGLANQVLARAAEMTGDMAEALTRARQSVDAYDRTDDRAGRARALVQLGRVGRLPPEEHEALLDRAFEDASAGSDVVLQAAILHSQADAYFVRGDYERALAALQGAAARYEGAGRLGQLGTVYNSIGRLYRAHGETASAIDFQLKALAIHERTSNALQLVQSLNAVAMAYSYADRPDEALAYQERAVAAAERTDSPRALDFVNANLANILMWRGEHARAAATFEAILARNLDAYPRLRNTSLAYAYLRLGRLADALAAAERAAAGCDREMVADCVNALRRRAEVNIALGHEPRALEDLRHAIEWIELQRTRLIPSDLFKQQYSLLQQDLYGFAITAQLGQGRGREALQTAELARARAFLDLLASRDLAIEEPARPEPAADPGAVRSIDRRLRSLPSSRSAAAADVDALIAQAARLQSTLVAYWVMPDEVLAWVVTPAGGVHSVRVPVIQSKLVSLIRSLSPDDPSRARDRVAVSRGQGAIPIAAIRSKAWRDLYDLLILPMRGKLPAAGATLTIVPHGPLTRVPFAGLQSDRGRYLIEDYTLHYAPTGPVLIVADATPPRMSPLDRPLGRLPGARAEAAAISGLVAPARLSKLVGADASEPRVRAAAARQSVIHIATHAVARDGDPFESFLALAPDASAGADGRLTAREIYELTLESDLVVLSACQSGGSVTADGIAAFARAFIHAGAPSMIVSLWDVPDGPTGDLIAGFYRSWLAGRGKAAALRAAQLDMLRRLRDGRVILKTAVGPVAVPEHPAFWAGLILIGEPE
jgi:tetratricopeptide (TPR) repeat protein